MTAAAHKTDAAAASPAMLEVSGLAKTFTLHIQGGVRIEEDADTLIVHGADSVRGGATVESRLDHRIAMAFLVLGLASEAPVTVDDASPIATSFPLFEGLMTGLGASLNRATR